MKKIFYLLTVTALLLNGCKNEEETAGNIYGVVTDSSATAEPMRGTGVELYDDNWNMLLRTTTYDDGHYEFNDLQAAMYWLKVSAEGYEETQYHVVVEAGRTARADMQLEKNTFAIVLTLAATNISGNFVTLNGEYQGSANEVGFIYATHSNSSNGGTRVTASIGHSFSTRVTNLTTGTYYVQAYAIWNNETSFGEVHSFQIKGEPVIVTLAATNVETNTATLNGKIEYAGDPPYTERGFVYSNSFENPTVEDDASTTTKRIVSGTSTEFSANVSGLTTEQTYYVRAYVTNSDGTVYGESVSFKPAIVDYIVLQSDGIMVQSRDISSGANWDSAVTLCENSTVGGYSDWRLPTIGELETLYDKKDEIGGFSETLYWSGTKWLSYGSGYHSIVDFYDGRVNFDGNSNTHRVRAVRTIP